VRCSAAGSRPRIGIPACYGFSAAHTKLPPRSKAERTVFYNGSVTATNQDPNAWWEVDLLASVPIGSIAIWNRADCCSERLDDYWFFVSDTPFSPTDTPATLKSRVGTWSSHQTAAPHPSIRQAYALRRFGPVHSRAAQWHRLPEPGRSPGVCPVGYALACPASFKQALLAVLR
jgi:hypothetical protein